MLHSHRGCFYPSRTAATWLLQTVLRAAHVGVSLGIGCLIGFYDGLVGPGTGTFLILLFVHIFGMDDVDASGTAKLVNLASNVAALTSLLTTGDVLFLLDCLPEFAPWSEAFWAAG